MKRPLAALPFVALLLVPALLLAQESVVEKIVKEGRENGKVMSHLDHITNKIGPRLTGSDNLTKAQEWARETFEGFGLKKCRLEKWGTFPVGFNRGPWSGKMLAPEERDLTCATMSWTAGTNGPVMGRAVLVPKSEEDIEGHELTGAWIVVTGRPSNAIYAACEKAGVAGFVRSAGSELIVTGGNHSLSWEKLPKRVTVQLVASHHKMIVDHLKAGKEVKLQFDIKNDFKKGPIDLFNVIAELPGTEKPDEYVIVGGHIDSWDGATGTTDNGTGTSTTIEAARLLTVVGARPKRTIRFMLWSGEEQGLLGSRAYIRKHPEELPKISAVLVHDGGTNFVSGINGTENMVPLFEKVFEPVKALDPEMPFKVRPVKRLPYPIGSDHDSYLAAGVPGFFWNQSRTKTKGQNYNHEHHTQHDLYPAAIPEFQQHSSITIAVGALGVANLDELLPREGLPSGRGFGGGDDGERRRLLGVNCDDDLVLSGVEDGSAADKAGLQPGDKILKLGDRELKDLSELREEIQKSKKDTTVTIQRDGKEMTLPVKFDR